MYYSTNYVLYIFQFSIFIAMVLSLYMLLTNFKKREYKAINCWQFPMLLAILIETFYLI